MKFTTLQVQETDFDKINENEKIFFITTGYLSNEITVLEKLLFLSTNFNSSNENLDSVNASHSLLLLRIIAGKLWEGWELLRSFFKITSKTPRIPIAIQKDLSPQAKTAFDKLKEYFNESSIEDCLIYILRNQFAFHYNPRILTKYPPNTKDIENLRILITEKDEPFFIFSEQIMLETILNKIDPTDHEKAFNKMFEEVMTMTKTFRVFCAECSLLMIDKYGMKPSQIEDDISSLKYNKELNAPFLFSDFTK